MFGLDQSEQEFEASHVVALSPLGGSPSMTRSSRTGTCLRVLALVSVPLLAPVARGADPAPAKGPAVDPALLAGLEWRSIGPFRGGRVTAVAGVTNQPRVFYFRGTGGGAWKTTDGGISWQSISDGQLGTGSVGAIAVAEADPNVIFSGWGRPSSAATSP